MTVYEWKEEYANSYHKHDQCRTAKLELDTQHLDRAGSLRPHFDEEYDTDDSQQDAKPHDQVSNRVHECLP
jgi:hypothetical protein